MAPSGSSLDYGNPLILGATPGQAVHAVIDFVADFGERPCP